jgi:hypothetical protein
LTAITLTAHQPSGGAGQQQQRQRHFSKVPALAGGCMPSAAGVAARTDCHFAISVLLK